MKVASKITEITLSIIVTIGLVFSALIWFFQNSFLDAFTENELGISGAVFIASSILIFFDSMGKISRSEFFFWEKFRYFGALITLVSPQIVFSLELAGSGPGILAVFLWDVIFLAPLLKLVRVALLSS